MKKNYDIVILGGVGDVLGAPGDTLQKLKQTIELGGHIIIDESYLKDGSKQEDIGYNNYKYLTKKQWDMLFEKTGLKLIETVFASDLDSENLDRDTGMAAITLRANELIKEHPDKKSMFEGYIRSQQNEYDDIDNNLESVIWILKKL